MDVKHMRQQQHVEHLRGTSMPHASRVSGPYYLTEERRSPHAITRRGLNCVHACMHVLCVFRRTVRVGAHARIHVACMRAFYMHACMLALPATYDVLQKVWHTQRAE